MLASKNITKRQKRGRGSAASQNPRISRVYIHTTVDITQTPPHPLISAVHRQLLKRLRPGSTMITFNYDLVIEESFETAKFWNPGDGFALKVAGISHEWSRQWLNNREVDSPSKSRIHLLKLHGSLGWVQYANRQVRIKKRPYVIREGIREKSLFVHRDGTSLSIGIHTRRFGAGLGSSLNHVGA